MRPATLPKNIDINKMAVLQIPEHYTVLHSLYNDIIQLSRLQRQDVVRDVSRYAKTTIIDPDALFQFQWFCGELERFLDEYSKPLN